MKRTLLLFCLFCSCGLFAQDTLVLKTNERLVVKVLEISPTEIHYKKYNNPDGPLYVNLKWEVSYIVYANGTRESFNQVKPEPPLLSRKIETEAIELDGRSYFYHDHVITEGRMVEIVKSTHDPKLIKVAQTVENARFLQYLFGAAGGVAIVGAFGVSYLRPLFNNSSYNGNSYYSTTAGLLVTAVALEGVSLVFKIQRAQRARSLVLPAYNIYIAKHP
jgi:hypothetical protein